MTTDITVVTAVFGHHDDLQEQCPQDLESDWICFTDDHGLEKVGPWRICVQPASDLHPNLAAKRFKLLPPVTTRFVVWVDANIEIVSNSFVKSAMACMHDGVALFGHPRRDCVFDEATASLGGESQGGKYDQWNLAEQVMSYREEGHPESGGLYACGVIAWDLERTLELRQAWLTECVRWSPQDQLSFPVVCRRLGIEPGVFPLPQVDRRVRPAFGNQWLTIHPHKTLASV